jgi:alkyldihydroxyacetonephosphate synthase
MKSYWGWGFEERIPGDDVRRQLGALIAAELGVDTLEVLPLPRIDAVLVPRSRSVAAENLPISADPFDRIRHTYGRAYGDLVRGFRGDFANAPDLVAHPRDEADVAAILDHADRNRIAVVPYGGGTSVVRGVECPRADADAVLCLDLGGLDRIVEIDETSRLARIQAGILGPALERGLGAHDLTLRHFPQSFEHSTLGGWIATRAGGHFATLYTHIDDLVASTRTLTPRGVIETRTLPASGAGPAPDRWILGSEGTLGVITEAVVRVRPRPKVRTSASVRFAELPHAVEAARLIVQSGLHPTNCRLLDPAEAKLNGVVSDGSSVLIVGFESDGRPLDASMAAALEIALAAGGRSEGAKTRSGEAEAWKSAFVAAPYLQTQLVTLGVLADTFETCCTWSAFAALDADLRANVTQALLETGGCARISCRFTHVYPDGPAPYYTFVTKARPGGELVQWAEIKSAASETLSKHGATITHHHAVGRTHRPWYEREVPRLYLDALEAAKRAVDPNGIMNPGVLLRASAPT